MVGGSIAAVVTLALMWFLRKLAYGASWLFIRGWRGTVSVVGPIMRWFSDRAMAVYGWTEEKYLQMLPAALARPGRVLLFATAAFAGALALVPMLGADLIPQLAQDCFEMTV